MFKRIYLAALLLTLPFAAQAITILPPCTQSGDCGVSDILGVLVNIAEFLLSIAGAVAFGFFIYGGILYILGGADEANVTKAKDTLRNATIGLIIIFASGILVRFTQSALTGVSGNICSVSSAKSGTCQPHIGDTCAQGEAPNGALWISIPSGYTDAQNPAATFVPESLECISKDNCGNLNSTLKSRNRSDLATYTCMDVSSPNATSCVRGLCKGGANIACCIKK